MDNAARTELEKEMREKLERELAQRSQQTPSATSGDRPAAADPRTKLETELREQLNAELSAKDETLSPRKRLEEQLRQELQTQLGSKIAGTNERQRVEDEINKRIAARLGTLGKPIEDKRKKSIPGRAARRSKSARTKTRQLSKSITKTTRELSEQDLKILQQKAKIDAKVNKQKLLIYVGITILTLIIAGTILGNTDKIRNFFAKSPPEANDARKRYIKYIPKKPPAAGTRQAAPAPPPVKVNKYTQLQMDVKKLRTTGKHQSAIDLIDEFKRNNSNYALDCRDFRNEIIGEFLAKEAGSQAWKNVRQQTRLLEESGEAEQIQQAIDLLANFWENCPDERFAADHCIDELRYKFYTLTQKMPADPRDRE